MKSETSNKAKAPFPLRLPEELMSAVRLNSSSNERSINAEITFQLKMAYQQNGNSVTA